MLLKENKEELVRKPAYDARQRYYDLVLKHFENAGMAALNGDLVGWHESLSQAYIFVNPWCDRLESEKIQVVLDDIKRSLNKESSLASQSGSVARKAAQNLYLKNRDSLRSLQKNLLVLSKHMMLPENVEDLGEEFSLNKWEGELS